MSRPDDPPIHIVLSLPEEALTFLARIAGAFDRIAPVPIILSPDEQAELERQAEEGYEDDAVTVRREQELAAVERLELRGQEVPEAVYKRLGLAPPRRAVSQSPTDETLNADQSELAKPPEPIRPAEPARPIDGDGIISSRKPGL